MGRGSGSVCSRWTCLAASVCLAASAALLLPPLLFLTVTPQTRPYYYPSSLPDTHYSTRNSTSTLKEEGSHGNRSRPLRISAMVDANSTFTRCSALLKEDGHLENSISSIANSARDGGAAAQPKIEGKEDMGRDERSFGDVGLKRIERDLAKARRAIMRAVGAGRNRSSEVVQLHGGFVPRGVVYRNPLAFHQ